MSDARISAAAEVPRLHIDEALWHMLISCRVQVKLTCTGGHIL